MVNKDFRYEQWLTDHRCEWEFLPSVNIERVNLAESMRNQARLNQLDTDKVERYAKLMAEGTEFPALIAYKNGGGRFVLITGLHRLNAAIMAKLDRVALYWVKTADTDLYLRELMQRSANTVEGDALSYQERLTSAVHMARTHHRDATDVAKEFGISQHTISAELRKIDATERLTQLRGSLPRITKGNLLQLHGIQSDVVLNAITDVVTEASLSEPQTKMVVDKVVRAGGSEADMLARLDTFRQSPEVKQRVIESKGGTITPRTPIRTALFTHLSKVNSIVTQYTTADALQIGDQHDIERLDEIACQVHFRIKRIVNGYRAATGGTVRDTESSPVSTAS